MYLQSAVNTCPQDILSFVKSVFFIIQTQVLAYFKAPVQGFGTVAYFKCHSYIMFYFLWESEFISQPAVSLCTYYVPVCWNSLSPANIVATQVSLSPRSQRLSIVLIWSFHRHCLNMG